MKGLSLNFSTLLILWVFPEFNNLHFLFIIYLFSIQKSLFNCEGIEHSSTRVVLFGSTVAGIDRRIIRGKIVNRKGMIYKIKLDLKLCRAQDDDEDAREKRDERFVCWILYILFFVENNINKQIRVRNMPSIKAFGKRSCIQSFLVHSIWNAIEMSSKWG